MAPEGKGKRSVGQYYLMEKIAQGGMAEIFKGLSYDLHGLKKTVVIKKILPHIAASKEFIDSLIDEAKIAVTLSHGNIAQTYDLGKVEDDYFMVMEYVEGRSLSLIHKRCVAAGNLIPAPYLCHFMCEVLAGLDYMHRRTNEKGNPLHIVHRDISPQNLMVTYSGTVKIIDFGIAKAAIKIGSTDSGILKGKFSYMSPEQARGDPIDHRSDIFSLGIIFHEMLTGKRLFKSDDTRETLRNVRKAKVEAPSAFRGDIPDELDRIVMKALSKDRRHRYAFASDMRDDLLKFLSTSYPDFKPSAAGDFVRDLFKEDIARAADEEEMKTPAMIIDHTSSALTDESQFEPTTHAKAPVDMKDFLLEEEEVPEETEGEPRVLPELVVSEEGSGVSPKKMLGHPWIKRHATYIFGGLSVLFLIIFIFAIYNAKKEPLPVATGEKASLMITTEPTAARIYVDGKLAGTGSPMTLHELAAGEDHEISVDAEGYTPQTQKLSLRDGEFRSLKIVLTKGASSKAVLIVSSTPPGATVYIDEMETHNKTPATITALDTGRHKLGLFLAGHRYWTKDLEAHQGETLNFDVTLAKNVGALSIDSVPNGALVLLNGVPSGQTPFLLDDIEPDKIYRVEVWLDGYEPVIQEVKIDAGKKEELHLTLKKLLLVPHQIEQPAEQPPAEAPPAPQPPQKELPVLPPANP